MKFSTFAVENGIRKYLSTFTGFPQLSGKSVRKLQNIQILVKQAVVPRETSTFYLKRLYLIKEECYNILQCSFGG
ncbi:MULTISPECIES: hypothetical protein [Eubacteriales]|jgi:hypothetical protein|uniref:hypothetical protein n=1 Tax=Eubacteriales TaxID=186802 RepID=UPI00026F1E2B|nr:MULTISPECIES: hypothetical protein [Eubacteriales]EJF39276.1 hypothetical protein HMPREF1141_2295 [Clostridium sp. MSTE9]MBS5783984.1 hypothetical protein [Clostridium sp.]